MLRSYLLLSIGRVKVAYTTKLKAKTHVIWADTDDRRLYFAYPLHFGKSGFRLIFFTQNPNIRIFVQVRYRLLGLHIV